VGLSRKGLHNRLQQCKANNDPLPPLRKHKAMEVYGYKYEELMAWWYEQETEIVP